MNQFWWTHLLVIPIIVPFICGALMLFFKEKRRTLNTCVSALSIFILLLAAYELIRATTGSVEPPWESQVGVYSIGDWDPPFGIVLVADRLSAFMLIITACLAAASFIYSLAFWNRVGVHFQPLFQFILVGLNGAFLTGDLFSLFVFFEIFLAASYGLQLHGLGQRRVISGLSYITVNLVGAFLLLIGISMIYAITGTLNLADLSLKAGRLNADDHFLFETACSILSVAFLIKAAAWPLNMWLPNTYTSASAPVAALFVIMTKVGIYSLIRVGSLLGAVGAPAAFGGEWMFVIGIVTIVFATFGILNEKLLSRVVSFSVILSSGILMSTLALPAEGIISASLFYMLSSVLAASTFYLIVELINRIQSYEKSVLNVSLEAFGLDKDEESDYSGQVIGISIPAALAFLGISYFVCALITAGLPPLSGFIGKFAILNNALTMLDSAVPSWKTWLLFISIIISGFACILSFTRAGIQLFWTPDSLNKPHLSIRESVPVLVMIIACILLTVFASPVLTFTDKIADSLKNPAEYIEAVLHRGTE